LPPEEGSSNEGDGATAKKTEGSGGST